MRSKPKNPLYQAGWWCYDRNAPIVEGTHIAAQHAISSAVTAARALAKKPIKVSAVYAICRPPGHHAGKECFGGMCFLNNAAAAAEILSRERGGSKVAIIDIGFHHGNGTQDIFYDRSDVFYSSVHADPNQEFPYYSGYPEETGEGEGEGYNFNVPIAVDLQLPGHGVRTPL